MALKVAIGALSGVLIGYLLTQLYICGEELSCEECGAYQSNPKTLLGLPGDLWLRSLSLVVLPLLFSNMVVVANSMASITNSSKMGKATIFYYMFTTLIAVFTGIATSLLFVVPFTSSGGEVGDKCDSMMRTRSLMSIEQDYMMDNANDTCGAVRACLPQAGDDGDGLARIDLLTQITSIVYQLVPGNIFAAFANSNLIGCIVFAFILGSITESDSLIVKGAAEVNEAAFTVIKVIIEFTPIGVCFLIAPNMFILKWSDIQNAVSLAIGIPAGLIIHVFVVYPLIFAWATKKSPFAYMKGLVPAVFTALGTSSSAATLPVTLQCVTETLGVDNVVAKFVLTIGATANMDGSAIYFPIAVVWLAKTVGAPITVQMIITLVFMSTLAAIGASPIPSSGLVLVKLIAESVGIAPGGQMPPLFSLIIALDPFFDRGCTMVNITGDGMGAGVIQAIAAPDEAEEPEIPMEVESSLRANAGLKAGNNAVQSLDPVFEGMEQTVSGRKLSKLGVPLHAM